LMMVADSSGGVCGLLASWVITVIRIVMWNQSRRCSEVCAELR
jgi:hypothetical protein